MIVYFTKSKVLIYLYLGTLKEVRLNLIEIEDPELLS